MIGGQLENLNTAELPLSRLSCDVEDQVSVTYPRGTAAAEADVGELGKSLLLTRGDVQRRSEKLPEKHFDSDRGESSR